MLCQCSHVRFTPSCAGIWVCLSNLYVRMRFETWRKLFWKSSSSSISKYSNVSWYDVLLACACCIHLLSACASTYVTAFPLGHPDRNSFLNNIAHVFKLVVLRTQSTEHMTFSLSLMGFITAVSWTVYGYLIHDPFVQVGLPLGRCTCIFVRVGKELLRVCARAYVYEWECA